MTRIIAGAAGGRRLAVPSTARPTTDRVREALFNMLAARRDFDGLRVLDLYAGSGALGLEALSRGAASVLFIESERRAADVIARNIATVGLKGAVMRRGAVAKILAGVSEPVDLVFADPPYDAPTAEVDAVLGELPRWMAADGAVIVERPAKASPLTWPAGWTAWPHRRYGDTRIEAADC